jgi:ATP-dependent Clp protease ATP-binding subunit ClpC
LATVTGIAIYWVYNDGFGLGATVMTFDYNSPRAKRARLTNLFTKQIGLLLSSSSFVLFVAGIALVALGIPLGWFVLSLAAPLYAIYVWQHEALNSLPAVNGEGLDAILESSVLAKLTKQPTPKQFADAAMHSQSAHFFVGRFGISPQFLRDLSSDVPADCDAVLALADSHRRALNEPIITGGMIVAALLVSQPQLKQLLPHLQLDEDDMIAGVAWYSRLSELIAEEKKPKRTGGIARDWSFGWTNMLNRFGTNISQQVSRGGLLHVRLDSHQNALSFLYDTFSSNGRQNAALIGPLGAGKSTIVHAFAESLLAANSAIPSQLKFRQIISLDAGAIISAARSRSELESLVNQLFVEAYHSKNVILCLDDAQLFLEDRPGSVDLSSILLPVLDGGGLRLILTMDEQRYLQISQRNPSLATLLNRINIAPATYEESVRVMQDQIISVEFQRNVTFMYQSLKEAYRLSERYMYDLAQPGKSVRLLEQAAGYSDNGTVTTASVSRTIEQTSGVKVGRTDDVNEKEKLLNLESLIHQRMINQTRAVSVVSDALRRARAGVRNESRPIGTFLFLGPTGVGKTELSKALAAVYFGGEDHMIRLDLNEYVRPEDVSRLIADGAQDSLSLTAQIMKQPFSVVLLDEIEKAHPQVLTTLLQLLDEGVLRDINNREVSFRDAIVIATSNAGADRIRQLIDAGQKLEEFEEVITNELIDSGQFRPEFLNRFDEIVVFRPLTQEELGQVVQLIIAGVNKTLEPQKIKVALNDGAIAKLASIGYDPRLGARPMRRMVQRSVENLIAKRLLDGSAQAGDTITITETDIQGS